MLPDLPIKTPFQNKTFLSKHFFFYRQQKNGNFFMQVFAMLKVLLKANAKQRYKCHQPEGLIMLTMLCLKFSHLWEHKSRHNFQDALKTKHVLADKILRLWVIFLQNCPFYLINSLILNSTIEYLLGSTRIEEHLFLNWQLCHLIALTKFT